MEQFETTIKEIFYFIAEYGIKHKQLDFRNIHKISEKDKYEFLVQVHKGFRLGQDLIIKEIIPLFKEKEELKKCEIQAKKEKNKELLDQIGSDARLVEYKIKILRHFADFIAWQIFKNDYYKARRFFSGNRNRPDLLNTNFDSVIKAVEYFHKQNELNFALISDLTSFIDIGDILLIDNKKISIVECKEGEVQGKVFDFLDDVSKDDFDIKKVDFSDKNIKFFEQAERTLKQFKKGNKLTTFLKNEKGIDPFSDTKIEVLEATNPQEYYFDYLVKLIDESKATNSTYGEIEGIIYIGIYRENKIPISPFLFKEIVSNIYPNNIVVDYLSIIGLPLKEPLFFKPFGVVTIFDLMFRRLKIFLAIDLDKFIDLFNNKGISARWLSRKETHKILDLGHHHKPFIYKNRAIEIIANNQKITLGDSFLIYLLLDNITPSSYVERYNHLKTNEGSP